VTFPECGIWSIWWQARLLLVDVTETETSSSAPRNIDLTDPLLKRFQVLIPAHLKMARRRTGELRAALQQLRAIQSMPRDVVESRYWDLHRVIAAARAMQQILSTTLEGLDEDAEACSELMALQQALGATTIEKSKIDHLIQANQRKEGLKAFQQSIAAMIESGEAASWIKHVSVQDLESTGGEVNRLYQLLVEGKKANSLSLDSATLGNASNRADIFSKKQCDTLLQRSSEVQALMLAETDRMVKETQEQEAAEKARRELEKRAQLIPRGSKLSMESSSMCVSHRSHQPSSIVALVQIHSLQNKAELNGSVGIYMGLGSGDRHVVKLYGGDKEVSLLKKNFELWNGSPYDVCKDCPSSNPVPLSSDSAPTSTWQCVECSFLHEGYLAKATICDLCDTPRGPLLGLLAVTTTINQDQTQSVASPQHPTSSAATVSSSALEKSHPKLSKIASQGPRKGTVWIRKAGVAKLIGPGGKNIRHLMAQSGAHNMSADKKDTSRKGKVPVHLVGSPEAIEKCCKMIEDFLGPKCPHEPPPTGLMNMSSVKQSLPVSSSPTAPAPSKPMFSRAPGPQPSVSEQLTPQRRLSMFFADTERVSEVHGLD